MPYFKNKYRIDSNRLENWDYSGKGIYFITICTSNREYIFGNIKNSKMILNQNGKIIENEILNSIKIREKWIFHNWIIMPNHIHLLLEIKEENPKFNYSTFKILEENIDVEYRNLFLNSYLEKDASDCAETHCSASLPIVDNQKTNEVISIEETHCSASLPIVDNQKTNEAISIEETHCSASLPIVDNQKINEVISIEETHCSASLPIVDNQKTNEVISIEETHCSASLGIMETTKTITN